MNGEGKRLQDSAESVVPQNVLVRLWDSVSEKKIYGKSECADSLSNNLVWIMPNFSA